MDMYKCDDNTFVKVNTSVRCRWLRSKVLGTVWLLMMSSFREVTVRKKKKYISTNYEILNKYKLHVTGIFS